MKKFTFTTFCLLCLVGAFAQKNFYDLNEIQDIKIVFGYSDWNAKMVAQQTSGEENYILAASCTINGVTFDSVGVKYKGNSSYRATNKKNPLHIKLDWVKSQSYNGIKSIKLSNIFADPSYIREPLSYKLLGNYMDCPEANFAKVYIEGGYYGMMTNVEPINNRFVSNHFGSSDNTFVKCNPVGGAGGGGGSAIPSLVYLGKDSSLYKTRYELESASGWKDLVALIDTIANNSSKLDKVLDIDKALWMLAFNNVFVNLDSYTGAFAQNYYLYKDNNDRFLPIVWDLNMSFGSFNMTGSGQASGTSLTQMLYDLHSTNSARPLIKVLLSNPTYKRMYVAHMRTMLNDYFVNKKYETEANTMRTFIDSEVKTDANPFYTYAQFQTGMSAAGGSGAPGQSVIGISTLMNARTTYLMGLDAFKATTPTVTAVNYTPKAAIVGEQVWVTANITNATTAVVNYREDGEDIFEKVTMYDDGAHQDGAANDGIFGAALTVKDLKMQYYIYAENANAGIFEPQRAEHEFLTLTLNNAGVSTVLAGELVINEFMAANKNTVKDPSDDKADDWLELYNNSNNSITLDNIYLSDDYTKPQKYQFANGLSLAPKSRMIVWLDEDSKTTTGIHANFKLSASGEQLMLSKADGTVLDSLTFGASADDVSFERCPDGTGKFAKTTSPTFNAANCKPLATNDIDNGNNISLYPNPANTYINVVANETNFAAISIYSINGQLLQTLAFEQANNTTIDISMLQAGIYFMKIDKNVVKKFIVIK